VGVACGKQASHWIGGMGWYSMFGPVRNCCLCWIGLMGSTWLGWCQRRDAVHKNLVDAHATVKLGCMSLCQGLWGSISGVWCRRRFLREDILHCKLRLGFWARFLLCCVVVMVGKLQACVWWCQPIKKLPELVVHFFQLSCSLVELPERGFIAGSWLIRAVAHRSIVIISIINDGRCHVAVGA